MTREAELFDQITTLVGKEYGLGNIEDFGPVELDRFRDSLLDDLDWSRKFINKQLNRVIAMFKWAAKKEFCSGGMHTQLKTLGGLKKGRTRARETEGVRSIEDELIEKTLLKLPDIIAEWHAEAVGRTGYRSVQAIFFDSVLSRFGNQPFVEGFGFADLAFEVETLSHPAAPLPAKSQKLFTIVQSVF